MSTKGNAESFVEMRGSLKIPDMIKGKSAYEIAVAHGFDGTEEEWLASLRGKDGTVGKDGEDGKDGLTPYIGENGNWWIGDEDTGVIVPEVVDTFDQTGKAADAKATGDRFADDEEMILKMEARFSNRLDDVERNIADILYKAISVTSFAASVPAAEIGSTVNDVTLYWMLNKTPVSVVIGGAAQDAVAEGEVTLTSLGLTADKTWTIRATDERGAVATKSASLSFLNGVYCGAAAMPAALDSAFIRTLQRGLRSGKVTSFTANADAGEYIWYALPKRYGTCTFAVGGFTGGFTLVTTMPFTNASGYTEDYYVYKSDNAGLGRTSVTVS